MCRKSISRLDNLIKRKEEKMEIRLLEIVTWSLSFLIPADVHFYFGTGFPLLFVCLFVCFQLATFTSFNTGLFRFRTIFFLDEQCLVFCISKLFNV
jgi:hypothetical protein